MRTYQIFWLAVLSVSILSKFSTAIQNPHGTKPSKHSEHARHHHRHYTVEEYKELHEACIRSEPKYEGVTLEQFKLNGCHRGRSHRQKTTNTEHSLEPQQHHGQPRAVQRTQLHEEAHKKQEDEADQKKRAEEAQKKEQDEADQKKRAEDAEADKCIMHALNQGIYYETEKKRNHYMLESDKYQVCRPEVVSHKELHDHCLHEGRRRYREDRCQSHYYEVLEDFSPHSDVFWPTQIYCRVHWEGPYGDPYFWSQRVTAPWYRPNGSNRHKIFEGFKPYGYGNNEHFKHDKEWVLATKSEYTEHHNQHQYDQSYIGDYEWLVFPKMGVGNIIDDSLEKCFRPLHKDSRNYDSAYVGNGMNLWHESHRDLGTRREYSRFWHRNVVGFDLDRIFWEKNDGFWRVRAFKADHFKSDKELWKCAAQIPKSTCAKVVDAIGTCPWWDTSTEFSEEKASVVDRYEVGWNAGLLMDSMSNCCEMCLVCNITGQMQAKPGCKICNKCEHWTTYNRIVTAKDQISAPKGFEGFTYLYPWHKDETNNRGSTGEAWEAMFNDFGKKLDIDSGFVASFIKWIVGSPIEGWKEANSKGQPEKEAFLRKVATAKKS